MDATGTSISSQLEGFLNSAKKLEDALTEERQRSQKIAKDYLNVRSTLENAVRDLQSRLATVTAREKKIAEELAQFKTAWKDVLARENAARESILENENTKRINHSLRNQVAKLEDALRESHATAANHSRQAEEDRRELQIAIARVRSAEAKVLNLQHEVATLIQNKRNADQEIALEKSRIHAESARANETEKARYREALQAQLRVETEKGIRQERELRLSLEKQLTETRKAFQESEGARKELEVSRRAESERTRTLTARLSEENEKLKAEAAILRMEMAQKSAQSESQKKEANKTLLMERLRFEATLAEMKEKLEALMTTGIYAEKIDSAPDGIEVFTAEPTTGVPLNLRPSSGASASP